MFDQDLCSGNTKTLPSQKVREQQYQFTRLDAVNYVPIYLTSFQITPTAWNILQKWLKSFIFQFYFQFFNLQCLFCANFLHQDWILIPNLNTHFTWHLIKSFRHVITWKATQATFRCTKITQKISVFYPTLCF